MNNAPTTSGGVYSYKVVDSGAHVNDVHNKYTGHKETNNYHAPILYNPVICGGISFAGTPDVLEFQGQDQDEGNHDLYLVQSYDDTLLPTPSLENMVGRDMAMEYLEKRREGSPCQVKVLAGPPGVGKGSVGDTFLQRFEEDEGVKVIRLDGSRDLRSELEFYFEKEAFSGNTKAKTKILLKTFLMHLLNNRGYSHIIVFLKNYDAETLSVNAFLDQQSSLHALYELVEGKKLTTIVTTHCVGVRERFEEKGYEIYDVKEWSVDEIKDYADSVLGDNAVSREEVMVIERLFGGLPVIIKSIFSKNQQKSTVDLKAIVDDFSHVNVPEVEFHRFLNKALSGLVKKIWLNKLSPEAMQVLAILSMIHPNNISFEDLEEFFPDDADVNQEVSDLQNRSLIFLEEGEEYVEYKFHQGFQEVFKAIIFSKKDHKGFGDFRNQAKFAIKAFIEKFAGVFRYHKYYDCESSHEQNKKEQFDGMLSHAEKIITSIVKPELLFLNVSYGEIIPSKVENLRKRKRPKTLKSSIVRMLGENVILDILMICSELAAYYIHEQHSYQKAKAFADRGFNILSDHHFQDKFKSNLIRAKLLTCLSDIYCSQRKFDRSIEEADKSIQLHFFLKKEFPEKYSQDKSYEVDLAIAYGTRAWSHIQAYEFEQRERVEKTEKFNRIEEAEACLDACIALKEKVYGIATHTTHVNWRRRAKLKILTEDYEGAEKILSSMTDKSRNPHESWCYIFALEIFGDLYLRTNNFERSIKKYDAAVAKAFEFKLLEGSYNSKDLKSSDPVMHYELIKILKRLVVCYHAFNAKNGFFLLADFSRKDIQKLKSIPCREGSFASIPEQRSDYSRLSFSRLEGEKLFKFLAENGKLNLARKVSIALNMEARWAHFLIKSYLQYAKANACVVPLDKESFNGGAWIFNDFFNTLLSDLIADGMHELLLLLVKEFFNQLKDDSFLQHKYKEGLNLCRRKIVVVGGNTDVGKKVSQKLEDGLESSKHEVLSIDVDEEGLVNEGEKLADLIKHLAEGSLIERLIYCDASYVNQLVSKHGDRLFSYLEAISPLLSPDAAIVCSVSRKEDADPIKVAFSEKNTNIPLIFTSTKSCGVFEEDEDNVANFLTLVGVCHLSTSLDLSVSHSKDLYQLNNKHDVDMLNECRTVDTSEFDKIDWEEGNNEEATDVQDAWLDSFKPSRTGRPSSIGFFGSCRSEVRALRRDRSRSLPTYSST